MENIIQSPAGQPSNKEKFMAEMPKRRIKGFLTAASYTVGNVIFFGAVGYLLDKQLDKAPLFMIIGIVVSYPLTQYLIYRKLRKL